MAIIEIKLGIFPGFVMKHSFKSATYVPEHNELQLNIPVSSNGNGIIIPVTTQLTKIQNLL